MLILGILIINFIIILAAIYFEWWNNKVYKFRINLLYSDYETYNKLPSYETMFYRFWVPLNNWIK